MQPREGFRSFAFIRASSDRLKAELETPPNAGRRPAKELTGDRSTFRHLQSFVRFRDNLIDHSFHVLRAFPDRQLPVRASAFAHDSLNVRHLVPGPEFIYFS